MKRAKRRIRTLQWSLEDVPGSPPMLGVVQGDYVVFENVPLTTSTDPEIPSLAIIAERVWKRPRR